MDNLTHTIVGLALGEAVQRLLPVENGASASSPAPQSQRRRLLLTAGALASNFPDLDLLLVKLLPPPLGYLLHHRGHTHTLLLEIPQALLLAALLWLLWPAARRLLAASRPAALGLAATIVGGLLLHIGMDYLNSYGVHPFYPFDMGWRYGDMIFIIEPLFWVGAGVPLILAMRRPIPRFAAFAVLALVLAGCTWKGYLHWASLAALAVLTLLVARIAVKHSGAGLAAGLALCVAFVGVQALASSVAFGELAGQIKRRPGAVLVDAALTAYPANPLCWNFAEIEKSADGQRYSVRRGVIALAPRWIALDACPAGLTGPVAAPAGAHIGLLGEDSASLAELRQRAASDCRLQAWLRFARIPLLKGTAASDLRFGTSVAPNFSTIELGDGGRADCPATVPPWAMPRAALLTP